MMRIIDEKGRLFRRINIIDFAVVLFFVGLMPMLYLGHKIFNRKPHEKEFVEIKITSKFVKLKPEILSTISVGDKEKDADGNVIGEIVSMGNFNPYEREIEIGSDRKLINKNPSLRQAEVTLGVNAEVRDKNIYYKDKQILENGMLIFSSDKYTVEIEGITIIKDDYNVAVGKQVKTTVDNYNNVDILKDKVDALEKKIDNSLLQITNRLGDFEKKTK